MTSRWASEIPVSAIAMTSVQPMPSRPIDRPEKTLVTMKATPCTVPTRKAMHQNKMVEKRMAER